MRGLIREAAPEAVEEWKWMGTPVWSDHGIVCTGESYTKVVKLTFAQGAKLSDPSRLFKGPPATRCDSRPPPSVRMRVHFAREISV